jgi:hypothetical protein
MLIAAVDVIFSAVIPPEAFILRGMNLMIKNTTFFCLHRQLKQFLELTYFWPDGF